MTATINTVSKKCLMAGLACWFTAGGFGFYGIEFSYRAVLYFVSAYAVYGLIQRAAHIKNRKVFWASVCFAVILTASFAAGHQISLWEPPHFPDLSLMDWICLIPYGGLLFVCVLNLVDWILGRGCTFSESGETVGLKYWRNAFLILTVLWMPYFLVFYPGNLSLDSFECVQQAIGDVPYGNNHPAAFVAVIAALMNLGMLVGDINFGIACFSLFQLLVLAMILAYVLFWLKEKGAPSWAVILCGAFFGLNPMIGTFSVIIWKDVLFGGFLLLLMTWLYDVAQSRGQLLATKRGLVLFALIAVFLSLWRNSMAVGICALAVILALCFRKHSRYFLPVCLLVFALIFTILGPVYEAAGIPKANAAESYGIPLQQIGYTLVNGGAVDEESRAFLDQIIPVDKWVSLYHPAGPDDVKFNSSFDHAFFNANTAAFMKVWLKLMPANLEYYIKAWLMNTIGYYHIGTIETAYWYGIIPVKRAEELGIFRTDLIQAYLGTDLVARLIEAFLFYAKKLPVFSTVYSIAANIWLFFLGVMIRILRRKNVRAYLWSVLPLLALYLIIMATTPAFCEFRYMFAFHLSLPVTVLFMFQKEAETAPDQTV